jgi:hypothetical protein
MEGNGHKGQRRQRRPRGQMAEGTKGAAEMV